MLLLAVYVSRVEIPGIRIFSGTVNEKWLQKGDNRALTNSIGIERVVPRIAAPILSSIRRRK